MKRVAVCAAALVGCGPTPPPASAGAGTAQPVTVGVPTAPAAVEDTAEAVPLPPELSRPAEAACHFGWKPPGAPDSYTLAVVPGGKPFARVAPPGGQLDVTRGAAGAFVTGGAKGSFASGFVEADDVLMFLQRPQEFGGVVHPTGAARLRLHGGESGGVLVAPILDEELEARLPLQRAVPCAGVSLFAAEFDVRSALVKDKRLKDMRLVGKDPVPFAATAAGPAVVLLSQADVDVEVEQLERKGAHARVLLDWGDVLLLGWVPARLLTPSGDRIGEAYGVGGLGLRGVGAGPEPERIVCPRSVPLIAEVDGVRRTVGNVAAGSVLEVHQRGRELSRFEPKLSWLSQEEGAWLGGRTADLRSCTPAR